MDLARRFMNTLPVVPGLQERRHSNPMAQTTVEKDQRARRLTDLADTRIREETDEHEELLKQFITAPISEQLQILRAHSERRLNILPNARNYNSTHERKRSDDDIHMGILPNRKTESRGHTEDEATEVRPLPDNTPSSTNIDEKISIEDLRATLITAKRQLTYSDLYGGKLVLVFDGSKYCAALMLSTNFYEQATETLAGNRRTFIRRMQRNANKDSRSDYIDTIDEMNAELEKVYMDVKEEFVAKPSCEQEHFMLSIKEKMEELESIRESTLSQDAQEADEIREIEQEQLESSLYLCQQLDSTFVEAGLSTAFEPPDFEANTPLHDSTALNLSAFEAKHEHIRARASNFAVGEKVGQIEEIWQSPNDGQEDIDEQPNPQSPGPTDETPPSEMDTSGAEFQWQPRQEVLSGIGVANVYPLDQWAPLLGDCEDVKADVWKQWQEIQRCETLLEQLNSQTDHVSGTAIASTTSARSNISMPDSKPATNNKIDDARELEDCLKLARVRHDIAKHRARWIGHCVDNEGVVLGESSGDYFDFEEARALNHEASAGRIERFIDRIESGHEEDNVEWPDLEFWDSGEELQVWDNPAEEDEVEWNNERYDDDSDDDDHRLSYKEQCQRYFRERQEAGLASED